MSVQHRPIRGITGSNKMEMALAHRALEEARKAMGGLGPFGPSPMSTAEALTDNLISVMAWMMANENEYIFEDTIRYFNEKVEAMRECEEEIKEKFKQDPGEAKSLEEQMLELKAQIEGSGVHAMNIEDVDPEVKEILEKHAKMEGKMGTLCLEDIPEEERSKVLKILKKKGMLPADVGVEDEEDRFRHYG